MDDYKVIEWKDNIVERPRTFTMTENSDGTITLTPAYGETIQEGTSQSAANFNKMDEQIAALTEFANDLETGYGSLSTKKAAAAAAVYNLYTYIKEQFTLTARRAYPVGSVAIFRSSSNPNNLNAFSGTEWAKVTAIDLGTTAYVAWRRVS